MKQASGSYFIECERESLQGGKQRVVERFNFKDTRDIVLRGYLRTKHIKVIRAGEIRG